MFGATGGIGSAVARSLLATGHSVRAIGRSEDRLSSLVALGAQPFTVSSYLDRTELARAMEGARAAYTMAPPIASDVPYARVGGALSAAARDAGVSHVVNLSALGADLGNAGGHVADYTDLEAGFAEAEGLNVLHIRPCLFMTSFYGWIPAIRENGRVEGILRGDLGVPRIASADTAEVVTEALLDLSFRGQTHRDLHGQRDLSMNEAASIIGEAIGMESLRYVQVTPEEWLDTQRRRFGRSTESAERMNLMYAAWNDGSLIRSAEPRTARNTTSTRFEDFVHQYFLPRYRAA